MSMFGKKEVMTMPKDVKVPVPVPNNHVEDYAPSVREVDHDAEGNFINAHRRLKSELAEARKIANDALIEIKAQRKIIERLEADLHESKLREQEYKSDADQALTDCAALENLFSNIASLTDSYLHPKEIRRQQGDNKMLDEIKEIVTEEVQNERRGD